jgi:hypothetical protein
MDFPLSSDRSSYSTNPNRTAMERKSHFSPDASTGPTLTNPNSTSLEGDMNQKGQTRLIFC